MQILKNLVVQKIQTKFGNREDLLLEKDKSLKKVVNELIAFDKKVKTLNKKIEAQNTKEPKQKILATPVFRKINEFCEKLGLIEHQELESSQEKILHKKVRKLHKKALGFKIRYADGIITNNSENCHHALAHDTKAYFENAHIRWDKIGLKAALGIISICATCGYLLKKNHMGAAIGGVVGAMIGGLSYLAPHIWLNRQQDKVESALEKIETMCKKFEVGEYYVSPTKREMKEIVKEYYESHRVYNINASTASIKSNATNITLVNEGTKICAYTIVPEA
jgi:hypothetical protein